MQNPTLRAGFTLTQLVLVILILTVLAGALAPRVGESRAGARDVRRLQDLEKVRAAITLFHGELGYWPAPERNGAFGGWDVSHDGNFISVLTEHGYLDEVPRDPIDDDTYHYRYYVYDEGTFGCRGEGPFYVLGIRTFESAEFAYENPGWFRCAGRDWSSEFAWVTGDGTSRKL